MLVNMREIMRDSQEKGYGVASVDVYNFETIQWTIWAAEAERVPVIIMLYPAHDAYIPAQVMVDLVKSCAQNVRVPVALHMDHAVSLDILLPHLRQFPSVMIDGSALSFEDNVAMTKRTVDIAHPMGIFVEAELGHVGLGSNVDDVSSDLFTKPEDAARFVEMTGCDALAVAIGNAHGAYVKAPKLDFARLQALRHAVDIPLVLHGGSGIPDSQFSQCVFEGMSKFNLFTDLNTSMARKIKAELENAEKEDFFAAIGNAKNTYIELARHKMRILNPKQIRVI